MEKIWEILPGMIEFSALYCMQKCVRTMLVGMIILLPVFLIRIFNKSKHAKINFYSMLLLLPAGFSGMNKLFYLPCTGYIPAYINYYTKPIVGGIYFSIMALLLARFIRKNRRIKKWVNSLPVWESEHLEEAISFVTEDDLLGWQKRYLECVQVHVTSECISPFSGGLLHPYVVMPEPILKDWTAEERRIALCHELAHIKSGHIFWMVCFQLLKIYWWVNPFIYLCEKYFRDDMEIVCDEKSIRHAKVSCCTYGRTLLNMITLMQGAGMEGTLCFTGRNDFKNIKERITSLSCLRKDWNTGKRDRWCSVGFTIIMGLLVSFIMVTSYPKYTLMKEIYLYDEELNLLDRNSDKLRSALQIDNGKLFIDEKKFRDILTENNPKGDYVYVSYDGIMKVPGAGGCGNAVMVAVEDYNDVFYLVSEGIESKIQKFWLKYLI